MYNKLDFFKIAVMLLLICSVAEAKKAKRSVSSVSEIISNQDVMIYFENRSLEIVSEKASYKKIELLKKLHETMSEQVVLYENKIDMMERYMGSDGPPTKDSEEELKNKRAILYEWNKIEAAYKIPLQLFITKKKDSDLSCETVEAKQKFYYLASSPENTPLPKEAQIALKAINSICSALPKNPE